MTVWELVLVALCSWALAAAVLGVTLGRWLAGAREIR